MAAERSAGPAGAAVPVLALLCLALSAALLPARWRWEKDRAVELVVDGAELRALETPERPARALAFRLSEIAPVTFAVYWDGVAPLGPLLDDWKRLLPPGAPLALRPEPAPFARPPAAPPAAPGVARLLPAGPAVWGFPDLDPLSRWLGGTDWALPWTEFSRQLGLDALARRFPRRLVRAHSLDAEEMARSTPAKVVARFRRAVKERGMRMLYVRFFPGLAAEGNLRYVEGLAAALRRDGFTVGPAAPRFEAWGKTLPLPPPIRQAAAFLAACLLPVLFFRRALACRSAAVSTAALSVLSLLAALAVASLLAAPEFALGLHKFRGVKAALIVPLLLAFASLYSREELRRFAARPVTVGLAGALLAAAGVLAVYVLRSGHGSPLDAGALELRFRDSLEAFFGVRPRFKEFAVGFPLLWLGFHGWHAARRGDPFWRRFDPRPVLLAGFVGPLSVVNTFCHAHVPLGVSLLRSLHGWWLGAIGGCLLIALSRAAARRLQP